MQMKETGAFGDFAGTINTASNTLKQLKETLKEVGMWLGQLTLVYLEPFLTRVLSITIALREMIKTLNIIRGYKYDQVRDDANSLFGEVESSAENAAEAIEQVKNTLLGFDKLNILGSTESNGITPDYKLITDQLLKYSSTLDGVKNKANEIAEKILTWAGFTYNAEENTWQFNETLETTEDKIDYVSKKFGELFKKGIETLLDKAPEIPKLLEGLIGGVVGVLDKEIAVIGQNIGGFFDIIFQYVTSATVTLNETVATLIDSLLTNILPNIIKNLPQILDGFIDSIFTTVSSLVDSIGEILGSLFENIPNALGTFIGKLPSIIAELIESVFGTGLPKILASLIKIVFKLFEGLATFIPNIIKGFIGAISGEEGFLGAFNDTGPTFVEGWSSFAEEISSSWAQMGTNIRSTWDDMFNSLGFGESFTKNLDESIGKFFKETLPTFVLNAVSKIKEFFSILPQWFNDHIWKPIGNFFIMIINAAIHAFESFLNFFVKGINDITSALSNIWTWTGAPAIGQINEVSFGRVPMLADGGVITRPTMAVMGEYSGASSNPEIATPENLMRKVFLESLLPLAQAIVRGDKEVVNAIDGLSNRPIQLNGRKVSESIYNDLQNEATRRGTTLAFS